MIVQYEVIKSWDTDILYTIVKIYDDYMYRDRRQPIKVWQLLEPLPCTYDVVATYKYDIELI